MDFFRAVFRSISVLLVVFMISSCSDGSAGNEPALKPGAVWMIQSADSVLAEGWEISSPGLETGNWYPAHVPSTVLHALVENGVYRDIFLDDNLEKIGSGIHGIPVIDRIATLNKLALDFDEILITAPNTTGDSLRRIIDLCKTFR